MVFEASKLSDCSVGERDILTLLLSCQDFEKYILSC